MPTSSPSRIPHRREVHSEINVTPLVDVCLVLLIIFMVVTPVTQTGYDVQVPPKIDAAPVQSAQLIVRLDEAGHTYINQERIPSSELGSRLQQAMANRRSTMVFFAADGDLPYHQVASFMDLVRDSGVQDLGIVFEDLGANQEPG